ncbi:MAG: dTDP-4-dehydrorhamnose 3,5-epimerase [Clostridiales Family XIII bacterium]|nr:dTDP-4-dehydrorhamnose 3,5-epimerase [Clostridiales Family XIII bacterium]
MNVIATKLEGVFIIEPTIFGDPRGWFYEAWSARDYKAAGLNYDFMQDNKSFSEKKGTLRGIHFQNGEHAQAKLVSCGRGAVIDFAVDLRKGSPTYTQWVCAELTEENKRQFMIPRGFGHAFLTLTDDVEFCYKADNFYNYEADRSIRYSDPDIAVDWGTNELILSDKDKNAPLLRDSDCSFEY